ncbi:DUF1566 domain-containing protein [Leptospira ellisii]|nr:DUF1566 domain-containing protein [Leptospira ellisii]MDV6235462.1 DUF1566 domain-containing protein [Leptospira ellisii]PKA05141.1 hypothetical protein CH375_06800 [Leptospira ellisii]
MRKYIRIILLSTVLLLLKSEGISAVTPFDNHVDLGNGVIDDQVNRVLWRKCIRGRGTAGLNYTDCTTVSGPNRTSDWATALAHCNGLNFGDGRVWRLPSVKELFSLVDLQRGINPPYIQSTLFPDTDIGRYWTSTSSFANGNSPASNSSGSNDPKQYIQDLGTNNAQYFTIPMNTRYRSMAYIVDFRTGGIVEKRKSDSDGYVRCVSGPY